MSKFFKALEQAERERADRPPGDAGAEPLESVTAGVPAGPVVRDQAVVGDHAEVMPDTASPFENVGSVNGPRNVPTAGAVATEAPPDDGEEVEGHLVSLHALTSFAAEQYRNLRQMIEQEGSLRVIAITSPAIGDGKTTTAVNLSGAFAQSPDSRVLLIDADLRMPRASNYLGMPATDQRTGLVDLLLDTRLPFEAAVTLRRAYNLWVMPAGHPPSNPYEVLKSPRLEWIVREARERYDFVILDAPPAVPLPDCRLLSRCIDGFLVVVTAHKTPRRLLQQTLEMIETSKLVGLVYNADHSSEGGYALYYAPKHGRRGRWARVLSRAKHPFRGPKSAARPRSS